MKLMISIFMALNLLTSAAFALSEFKSGKTKYIAAVLDTGDGIEVWINTRKHWVQYKSLVDSYTAKESVEVDKITEQTNLCNLAESQYVPCRAGRSADEIKNSLISAGVEIDREFQTWAEKEIGIN